MILVFGIITAQTNKTSFDRFYSGDENYNKPIKHVFFDELKGDKKIKEGTKIYFHMEGESFLFDSKTNKTKTLSIENFKKLHLEDPKNLADNEYSYFKKKLSEFQKGTKTKTPLSNAMPISRSHKYFKVCVIEKTVGNIFLKYDVDWIYSTF